MDVSNVIYATYSLQYILYIIFSAMYSMYWILFILFASNYIFILHTVLYALNVGIVFNSMYCMHSIIYSVLHGCIIFIVFYWLYFMNFSICNVFYAWTLYIILLFYMYLYLVFYQMYRLLCILSPACQPPPKCRNWKKNQNIGDIGCFPLQI